MQSDSIEWFIQAIRRLPSDEPVPNRQPGYNDYRTQKDHWLGWLDPNSGTGTYPRRSAANRDARYVYNHIVEPKLLFWLISAAGVEPDLVKAAKRAAEAASSLAGKSAAIRKQVPWPKVAAALKAHESTEVQVCGSVRALKRMSDKNAKSTAFAETARTFCDWCEGPKDAITDRSAAYWLGRLYSEAVHLPDVGPENDWGLPDLPAQGLERAKTNLASFFLGSLLPRGL